MFSPINSKEKRMKETDPTIAKYQLINYFSLGHTAGSGLENSNSVYSSRKQITFDTCLDICCYFILILKVILLILKIIDHQRCPISRLLNDLHIFSAN